MAIKTAEEAKKALEDVTKYSPDDTAKAIAAGVLSLMLDMATLHKRLVAIEERLSKK